MKKNIIITGCAGFIGSHLTDYLLSKGYNIYGIDNFSTGKIEFLKSALKNEKFELVEGDLLKSIKNDKIFENCEAVFHLCANADVRRGMEHPKKDIEQNIIVTSNVLELMRFYNVKNIAFSSTGSVYGNKVEIPTPENCAFPIQTSLYSTSKVAAEGLITSYVESCQFRTWIFRFVSLLGERYTHGHVFDFYKSLKNNPHTLEILGDGKQKKSYLYVKDCVKAMFTAFEKSQRQINIFNLGLNETIIVSESAKIIAKQMQTSPEFLFSGGIKGWAGDNPHIHLCTNRITELGWKPSLNIKESILKTVKYFSENEWLFKK